MNKLITSQLGIILGWLGVNVLAWSSGWDPTPFILINILAPFLLIASDIFYKKTKIKQRHSKSSFVKFYTRFRASKIFLLGIVLLIASWLGFHWFFGIDQDLGGINLFLSAEASVSLAFFAIVTELTEQAQARESKKQDKKLNKILRLLMPYKSKAQAAYFNIHRKELERQGVDVDEWNTASKGRTLPKKSSKKRKTKK
jgi:hypothetical protein